jgi:hypothetical protein
MILLRILFTAMFLIIVHSQAAFFDNLSPHTWYEIPNSHMSTVDPCPNKGCSYSGSGGQAMVIGAWSGGAFDTKRDRLIVWGGGHSDYAGNEVYTFDLATQTWRRESEPALDVSGGSGTGEYAMVNGLPQPRGRHTYEFIEYMASIDRFCSFGFASPYPDGGQGGSRTHCFDFDLKKWERKAVPAGWGLGALSAYDPVTGHGWVKGTDSHSFLCEFMGDSGAAGTWVKRSSDSGDFFYKYALTMDIDPVARKLVAVGGGEVWYWDISNTGKVTQTLTTTTGATGLVGANDPGFAYDPVTGKILGWSSGQTVYSLDVPSKTWTSVSASGANPGSPNSNGTYGRFRYSSSKNVFVVVNSASANVFIYKHTAGSSLEEARSIQVNGAVLSAMPNPFYPSTKLGFKLDGNAHKVCLKIYDISGRLVKEVLKNRTLRGTFETTWAPDKPACETYIARLTDGNKILTQKLFFIK